MTGPSNQVNLATEVANQAQAAGGDIADELNAAVSGEIAALLETIAELTAKNEQQAVQLNELCGSVEWLALRACDAGGHTCETLRTWCVTGVVESQREGTRIFVNTRSLAAHLKRKGLAKAVKKTS